MAKKKSIPKGIPDHLQNLYVKGQRIRYHGFWLGENEKDRVVARWIDKQVEAGNDVGDFIKALIYDEATGKSDYSDKVMRGIEELRQLIESGVFVRQDAPAQVAQDVDDLLSSLRDMRT